MDGAEQLSRGGSAASQSAAGRGYPSLRMDFTSLTGQLSSAGITRTRPPAPISACELTSSSMGTTESSVSGVQSRVRSRSPGKICHREPSSSSTMWLSEWDRILVARSFRVGGQCVVQSATSVPTGPGRSSCWGLACWLRGGRPHSPPQRRACRGQPCGRRRRRRWRP